MSRPKRATAQQPKNYSEQDIGDTPLVSTIRWPLKLPGLLKISNACFANEASNVRRAAQDGLVVVVTEGEHERAKNGLYGGADVAYFPFRDEINEPEATVRRQIRGAVGAVRAHWKRKPGTTVLVHCSAGQNRSAAVVLAVLRAYGLNKGVATYLVRKTQTTKGDQDEWGERTGAGESWERGGWEKFQGENGKRLLESVLAMAFAPDTPLRKQHNTIGAPH